MRVLGLTVDAFEDTIKAELRQLAANNGFSIDHEGLSVVARLPRRERGLGVSVFFVVYLDGAIAENAELTQQLWKRHLYKWLRAKQAQGLVLTTRPALVPINEPIANVEVEIPDHTTPLLATLFYLWSPTNASS